MQTPAPRPEARQRADSRPDSTWPGASRSQGAAAVLAEKEPAAQAMEADLDPVTGLPNADFFHEQLRREMARQHRETSPLTLVLIDIDGFSATNERFGRALGDQVLAAIARTLRANLRTGDVVARYGADEFILLLPATPKLEAGRLADRLRFAIAACAGSRRDTDLPRTLTVGVGVTTSPADATDEAELVAAARQALSDAKASGNDQVRLYGGSTRSYARCKAAWTAHVRALEPIAQQVQTIELGESGLMFHFDVDVPKETLLEVVLTTPTGNDIRVAGRVAWTRPAEAGGYEVALRAVEGRSRDTEQLARWVRAIEKG